MSRRLLDKLPKMMEDSEFVTAWEEAREEFSIAREIIRTRVAAGMSQKELAEKIGTTQSVIARLESGGHTPSLSTLKRVAEATHSKLSIELVPADSASYPADVPVR
ncbi:MAG: helix-turn-helix domain-containing protein [Desulfovibrio sp.]|jgi:transcriptional regulator with XRE-family HTH domain|nr:helix-turn-helix domain-containing protein [Desulfovibrio sp.]